MKKPTNTEALAGQSSLNNTSTHAQRVRLLNELKEQPITTYEARQKLNITSPAPRIKELREKGHNILTVRGTFPDSDGRLHPRSAKYVLINLAKEAK